MRIVALTGRKGSGKSTAANYIQDTLTRYDIEVIRYSFAEPLKKACKVMFGGSDAYWYGAMKEDTLKKWGVELGEAFSTPRRILQTVGTELFRQHVHEQFWVLVADAFYDDYIRNYGVRSCVVIDDCRFDNEAAWVREMGGKVYAFHNVSRRIQADAASTHASEAGVSVKYLAHGFMCAGLDEVRDAAKIVADEIIMSQSVHA